ncbi:MAG: hypothetical protein LBC37_00170 [Zoogloeaceae bacterium]|jgi:hypothetical protein|nr:hypothetical protein [Zoogloeaceae bacterium]
MKTLLKILLLSMLLNCGISAAADKTPFEGAWERENARKNEMSYWKFSGNTYERYRELAVHSGEHYYKGTFTYEELPSKSGGMGTIQFKQTHSAVTKGDWKPAKEATETTGYRFIDDATLTILSVRYKKAGNR